MQLMKNWSDRKRLVLAIAVAALVLTGVLAAYLQISSVGRQYAVESRGDAFHAASYDDGFGVGVLAIGAACAVLTGLFHLANRFIDNAHLDASQLPQSPVVVSEVIAVEPGQAAAMRDDNPALLDAAACDKFLWTLGDAAFVERLELDRRVGRVAISHPGMIYLVRLKQREKVS